MNAEPDFQPTIFCRQSYPMRLFLCLLLTVTILPAHALGPLEEAQLQAYFFDRLFSVAKEYCAGQDPHIDDRLISASTKFRQTLGTSIEAGSTIGSQLAARRGQKFDQIALDMAHKTMNGIVQKPGQHQRVEVCSTVVKSLESMAQWALEDLLKLGYEKLIRSVENAQGYPCDMLRGRADEAVEKFVLGNFDFTESRFIDRALLADEAQTLLRLIGNCEKAQFRAHEFRVTALEDFATPKHALLLIEKALLEMGADRQEHLLSTVETLKAYRPRNFE